MITPAPSLASASAVPLIAFLVFGTQRVSSPASFLRDSASPPTLSLIQRALIDGLVPSPLIGYPEGVDVLAALEPALPPSNGSHPRAIDQSCKGRSRLARAPFRLSLFSFPPILDLRLSPFALCRVRYLSPISCVALSFPTLTPACLVPRIVVVLLLLIFLPYSLVRVFLWGRGITHYLCMYDYLVRGPSLSD